MLSVEDVSGAGFVLITEDLAVVNDLPAQSQENINKMFLELQEVIEKYGFDISIVSTHEDAKVMMGKLLINDLINKLVGDYRKGVD